MKYLLIIIQAFLIVAFSRSSKGENSNELEESIRSLAQAASSARTDFMKISFIEDSGNDNFTETGKCCTFFSRNVKFIQTFFTCTSHCIQ